MPIILPIGVSMLKDNISKLELLGYDEDDIVATLKITHSDYRKYSASPSGVLSYGARVEIYNMHQGVSVSQLCNMYKVKSREIHNALRHNLKIKPTPSKEQLDSFLIFNNFFQDSNIVTEVSRKFQLPAALAKRLLNEFDYLPKKHNLEPYILALLKQKNKLSYYTIAKQAGCSENKVAKVASKHQIKRQGDPRYAHWPEVMKDLDNGMTISEASRKHNVTRASIYNHMSKKHD